MSSPLSLRSVIDHHHVTYHMRKCASQMSLLLLRATSSLQAFQAFLSSNSATRLVFPSWKSVLKPSTMSRDCLIEYYLSSFALWPKTKRWYILLGLLCCLSDVFLPWYSVSVSVCICVYLVLPFFDFLITCLSNKQRLWSYEVPKSQHWHMCVSSCLLTMLLCPLCLLTPFQLDYKFYCNIFPLLLSFTNENESEGRKRWVIENFAINFCFLLCFPSLWTTHISEFKLNNLPLIILSLWCAGQKRNRLRCETRNSTVNSSSSSRNSEDANIIQEIE